MKRREIIINIQLVAIIFMVIFLYSFTSKRNAKRTVAKPLIEILEYDSPFVTHEMVNNLLKDNYSNAFSFQKDKVDLNKIEHKINKHDLIENSEVFLSVDGKLKTVIKQRTPIVRFFNENTSFYIDYKGSIMPISNNYTARVPLVFGDIEGLKKKEIIDIFKTIYEDDFLKKNIIGLHILENGNVIMKNRNFDYDIIFGNANNIKRKFTNYKAFFQKAIQDTLIGSYKEINLRFTKQVVCTK